MSDDFFAPPPFNPDTARATLVRALRDLKLAERGGAFELNGQPVVKVHVDGGALRLDVVRRPSRSPDWEHAQATDGTYTEAKAGEALVIPAGFAGSFEVLERVRKHFVIVVGPEAAAA